MKLLSKEVMVTLFSRVLTVLMFICAFDCDYIPKWSCDFENGLCNWLQAVDDEKDFMHVLGSSVGWSDHTTKSLDGKFLYLHIGGHYVMEEGTAKLMSPILMPNNGSCKMVVHYKIYKNVSHDKAQVNVNMISKLSSGRIYRKPLFQSLNSSVWARQDVILQSNVEFQVEIVGVIKAYSHGEIGIDDLWFTAACQTNEESPIRLIKPQPSHSYNYPAGVFYENVNGSWSAVCSEDRALSACNLLGLKDVNIGQSSLMHDHLKSGQGICLPSNITVPTSKVCNHESSCRNVTYWECKQDYITICPKLTHVACNSTMKNPVCISLNQICDHHPDCPGGEDESDCLAYNRCDFRKDMCDWMASKDSFYEWERYYDSELKRFYLNVHSYYGRGMDGIAKLKLKHLIKGNGNSTCTIRFMYRTRSLMRMVLKEKIRNETVWKVTSTSGQWRRAFVQLPGNRSFQVYFEAFITNQGSLFAYFGLANISFSKDCHFSNDTYGYLRNDSSVFVCHSGQAVEKNVVCDYKADCYDGSDESNCSHLTDRCDFESSFCGWQVGVDAPKRLLRWLGESWGIDMNPSRDHTNKFRMGNFVYLESNYMLQADSYGYLISRTFQRSLTKQCTFRWFYYMRDVYSGSMGKLSIIYYDIDDGYMRTLWEVEGSFENAWKYGSVTFHVTSLQYKIMMKVNRGASLTLNIAIDDVSFSPECLQADDFGAITITKYPSCPSVKSIVMGSSASLYQFGRGRVFCNITIRTDPRLRIKLDAEFFNTDSSKIIFISNGGNFSGSVVPFSMISSTNLVNIRVPPLDGLGSHSFTFNLSATHHQAYPPIYHWPLGGSKRVYFVQDCGGLGRSYSFTSPVTVKSRTSHYGQYYYNNERCIYKFVASNRYRIKFTFTMFETEINLDYLQILNNGIIGQSRFTGSYNGIQFVSKRSNVEMLFVTNESVQKRGFSLTVMATDELASAAKTPLPTTIRPWFSTTPSQRSPTASPPWFPSVFLSEECPYQSTSPQFATGDSQFGKIYFDSRSRSSYAYLSLHCSWRAYGSSYSKYLLELTHIDTGSLHNVLTVNYKAGKSKEFIGRVSVIDLDLYEADNQFTVTASKVKSMTFQFQMSYSRNPVFKQQLPPLSLRTGCYSDKLLSHYTYNYKAYSGCYCVGFKYGFLASNGNCYCGNRSPAYYGFFMQNTSHCTNCIGSCSSGKLFIHTSKYNTWLSNQNIKSSESKVASAVIVSTVSLLVLMIIYFVAYMYCKRKYRASTRRFTTARNQGGNGRSVDPCAYFVNEHPVEGMLPSYEDSTKDRVFFFNTLQDEQNLQSGIGEAIPSFDDAVSHLANDKPPEYAETVATSNQTRPQSTGVISGLLDDYSDLMAGLPDVESTDRPLSREGGPVCRGESRNSPSLSFTSLRNTSPELSAHPLIVASLHYSERERLGDGLPNDTRHERSSEVHERPLEDRRRSEELRGLNYGAEGSIGRNRNRATDLPPFQRVRAYDNRGVDST